MIPGGAAGAGTDGGGNPESESRRAEDMMAAEDMTVAVGGYDSQGVFRGNYNLIEAVTRINLDSTSSAGLACLSFLSFTLFFAAGCFALQAQISSLK